AEERRPPVAACDEPGGAFGDPEGARGAERAGELELLVGEASRGLELREREVGERSLRPPREVAGAWDPAASREPADAEEVGEAVVDPSLRYSEAAAGSPKDGRRERVAFDLFLERTEHLLRRAELALLEQRAGEDARVEDAEEHRSPQLRRGKRDARV